MCTLLLRGHARQCLLWSKGHVLLLHLLLVKGHALLQCRPLHRVCARLLCLLL